MHDKVIKEICSGIKSDIESHKDSIVLFSDPRYKALPLSQSNFHQLREHYGPIRIGFVDGGNAEIISTPNFCVSLIRVYYCVFEKNKKIKTKRTSFYCQTKAVVENEKLRFNTKLFFIDGKLDLLVKNLELLDFDSFDATLRSGIHRAEISKVAGAVRRFAELSLATELATELKSGDIIVLDGTLQSSFTHETKFFDSLYSTGLKNEVLISSVAKTCRLFTDSGNNILSALSRMAPVGTWYYHPIVQISHQDHLADMFFARLHEMSDYIFRIELYQEQKKLVDVEKFLGVIAKNSVDPVFLGYPYGLIDADKFAQISDEEKKLLQTRFKMNYSGKELSSYLNSLNAHDILNKL